MSRIHDYRTSSDFRVTTFSEFKMTDVRKQFVLSMHDGKIEPACYWCAEMICSGHFADAWELILLYMAKYIHLGNPKIAIYLEMRYSVFRNIMQEEESRLTHELDLRNSDKIRKLFAEIVCTLTLSNKKPCVVPMTITSLEEFDVTHMAHKLKAPSMDYASLVFRPKDPKELFIAVNEFAYHVSPEGLNMTRACYWLEWAMEFEVLCRRRKEPCFCERRDHPVDRKFSRDLIWLFWDVLIHYAMSTMSAPVVDKTMSAILRLFCMRYTTACCKRRRHMLYYAIGLLTESGINFQTDLFPDRETLQTVVQQIDHVYKQIKKNEKERPHSDFMLRTTEKERTMQRSVQFMDMVNSMDVRPHNPLSAETH